MADVMLRLRLDNRGVPQGLQDTSTRVGELGRHAVTAEAAAGRLATAVARVAHYGTAWVSAQMAVTQVTRLLQAADAYQRISAGLTLVEGSAARSAVAMQDVMGIAQRQGAALDAVATAYQRTRRAMASYGGTGADAARVTETVSAALRLNNASTAEADSVLRQFSQAMGKGRVNGDEFMSMMENAPTLMDAVARSLGKTKGELYEMSEAGTLTSEVFGGAVLKSYQQVTGEAAKMPRTMGQATQEMQNAFMVAAGESDAARLGLSTVTQAFELLGQNATAVLNVAVAGGFAVAAAGAGAALPPLAAWVTAQVASGLAAARTAVATVALAGSISASAGAMGVATVAATAMGVAVRLALGPVGLAISAAAAAWAYFGDSSQTAESKARDAAQQVTKEVKKIDQGITQAVAQQDQLQIALNKDPGNEYLTAEIERLDGYIAKMKRAREVKLELQARDQETGNGRGNRDQYEREVAASTKFVQAEAAKAAGLSKDYQEQLTKYQEALARGVLTEQEYVQALTRLAKESYKLTDAQKASQEQAVAGIEFALARQKLVNQDLLADVQARVAAQVLSEEDGVRRISQIKADEVRARMAAESKLASLYAQDPAKAAGHTNAAKLAAQELINTQNEGVRDLQALASKREKAYADAMSKLVGDSLERRQALQDEAHALQLQTQQAREHGVVIESVATLLERETAGRYGSALAAAEQNLQTQRSLGLAAEQIKSYETAVTQLRAMRDASQAVALASASKDLAQAGLDQTKRLGPGAVGAEDPFKAWGSTLRETFATAGDGLARMVDAMGLLVQSGKDYAKEMAVIQALRDSGDASSMETAAQNEQALIKKTQRDQVSAYASMASAAKGYFREGSTGYKAMAASEKALRTYQLVMSAQTMAKDLVNIGAKVAAWLAGDAAITTSAATSAGTQVAASMTAGAASAAAGVANQAKGDPYTALPRMAIMAAAMAALGFAVSGGGGGGTTYDSFAGQEANDGSGTVFGDVKAQSNSIKESLQALESMARPELAYTSQMVGLLRGIEGALTGTTNLLLASGFDALGATFQGTSSKELNLDIPLIGGLFGSSSSSSSLSDTGLAFDSQSIASAIKSLAVQTYQVIRTDWKDSGILGFGGSSGTNYRTSFSAMGETIKSSMSAVLSQLLQTVTVAGEKMGTPETQLARLSQMDTGLSKVSLKGKTGEEVQQTLTAVFSELGDRMARMAAPALGEFQRVGEGYLQTLTRVSSGIEEAEFYTEKLGVATAALSSIKNKNGDVAAELVRESLLALQTTFTTGLQEVTRRGFLGSYKELLQVQVPVLSGIGKMLRDFSGSAADLTDFYKGLINVQSALVSLGQSSAAVTSDLLKGAGSMDALRSGLEEFETNFLTEAERAAAQQTRLAAEFARIGVLMPATAEQFKALVKTLDTSTAEGQKTLGGLLTLSGAFKELLDSQSAANKAAQDAADAAAKAQKDWVDKLVASGKSISEWLGKLDEGALGLKTPDQKLTSARGQYLGSLALARSNDQDALSSITGQAQAYLQASRDTSTSQAQYAAVLAQVRAELQALPAVKSYETKVLDALSLIGKTTQGVGDSTDAVKNSTDGVVSSTESVYAAATKQYQALIAMNNQTMYAVSANTAGTLNVLNDHSVWLRSMDATLAKIAATPASGGGSNGGRPGGTLGKILGGVGDFVGGVLDGIFSFFADGGVFSGQGIYNQPTAFTFDGGRLGVMGEAGPEAVMPLRRMSDGALGVRSQLYVVHHAAGDAQNMAAILAALQVGFEGLARRIEALDDNNNRGNAAIARGTARTANVLEAVSLGDAIRTEVAA